jgi:glycosyltransferase involved in cell wall biosynthesis
MEPTKRNKMLTIAILTYNRREYLREVLKSFTLQTFRDFEVIIFDNASDYDVHELAALFPSLEIKVDANEKNIGGPANFRKVVSYDFVSPYVMMFHDDDTLHPEYLEKAIDFLEANSQVVWVGSNIKFIENATPEKMEYFAPRVSEHLFEEMECQELVHKLLNGFGLGFASIVYRLEAFKKAVIREVEFDKWLDRPFIIDIAQTGNVGVTEGCYMNYRVHEGQDSQHIEPLKLNNAINLFKYYRKQNNGYKMEMYKKLESNNAINTAYHVASTIEEFFSIIHTFKKEGMFSLKCVGLRGVYYFIKFFVKYCTRILRNIYIVR